MALDAKYGQIDIPGVPEDMPVFILLAKDVYTVPTLARYRNFMEATEENPPSAAQLDDLDVEIARHADWRAANPDQMKVAD